MPGGGRGTFKDIIDNAVYAQYMCEKYGLSNNGCELVMKIVGHTLYEAIKADKYDINVTPIDLPATDA